MKIAIDGPSGAGKSTVARRLAEKLNISYLDTGSMYRAVALKAQEQGYFLDSGINEVEVKKMLKRTAISIVGADIFLDNKNVSKEIRQHHMSKLASDISALKSVRLWLVDMQRKIAEKQSTVLDGRDIGTFVLPNAEYKFFLTASSLVRAKRRYTELQGKGEKNLDLDRIKADIEQRDFNDSNRDFAPLKKADDAVEVDTSELSIEQVVDRLVSYVK